MSPSALGTNLFGVPPGKKMPDESGGRCEIYVEDKDVGTLHKLTVAYAYGKTHQLINSHLRPHSLNEESMKTLTEVYYGASSR